MIAETAYPFTLSWNDWTHNIIGSEDQIIASLYPASPQGQLDFMTALKDEIYLWREELGSVIGG